MHFSSIINSPFLILIYYFATHIQIHLAKHALQDDKSITQFDQLPLSKPTLDGLKKSHFVTMTDIQKQSIPLALMNKDILGAARTGSGKTLAFLIPILESLYHSKWTQNDGLGALIISPTRELALQIFEVLRKIGREHGFSAGLIIGGKDVHVESERLTKLNILICTPGRLLQHMDQTAGFDLNNIQCLVLDEADRILDMGFKKTLDAILDNIPPTRQTLLFSATQAKSVSDLARLSLTKPEYVSAHEEDVSSTPSNLDQHYVTVGLEHKLDTLWGFIKTHTKSKILVFISSSKQVRFVYETFRTLQPGIPLLHLHGKQKQTARIDITKKFSAARESCLFATDIVARGIDFPAVDWVIQLDCPEDAATYIHRVGRSARCGKAGKALLFLTPSEEPGMTASLEAKKVPIAKINIKESKKKSIKDQLQALCFQNPEIKYLGQKAFISYFRSIYIQKDKDIFKIDDLPSEKFAESLGLPGAPKIKILGGNKGKEAKNASRKLMQLSRANVDGEDPEDGKKDVVRTKYDRMFERKNQNVLSEHYMNMTGNGDGQKTTTGGEESEDEFMMVKRQDHALEEEKLPEVFDIATSKRAAKKALSKKASATGISTKLIFDDEGMPHSLYEFEDEEDFKKRGDAESQKQAFVEKEAEIMEQVDTLDKQVAKEKKTEKKLKRKEAMKAYDESSDENSGDDAGVELAPYDDANNQEFSDEDSDSESEKEAPKRKWFQTDDEEDRKKSKRSQVLEIEEPETLDDLEALSAQLLARR
ncbi:DEAD-domain-containing protein [Nadsonia fulvescens var. elongata DSM 6958]|uniref:ATP-dependent RNA helicase n=1 Tax=Nadsonia fulvescens var. elongata DSM 6958 TaxID=857566 RepID=A0A1E3PTN5_9ASCO|nr:DEAD-domain-containing protein [Nadsonia fulvescens var. elongata DSM 6958]